MTNVTSTEMLKLVKDNLNENLTALNGIADSLPEPMKCHIVKLREDLNKKLAGLLPLDQVPAAEQANYALNQLVWAYNSAQESYKGAVERLAEITKSLGEAQTALNGLNDQVAKGEYVTKAAALELAGKARTEAEAELVPQIQAMRAEHIALLGLPAAPADVMALPADKFSAAVTAAAVVSKKLGERGFALGGKGAAWVTECAWLPETALNGRMAMLDEVAPLKASAHAVGDPLLGQPAVADGNAAEPTAPVLV